MRDRFTNFTGGEVSGVLSARYDLAKYKSSCRHSENFIHELHGAVRNRGGTYFLEDLGGPGVLIPFEFSSDPTQNYVLIIQAGKARVAQENGFVLASGGAPVSMTLPYTAAQLYDISFAQSGDMLYLAHIAHPLRKIVRQGHNNWTVQQVTFTSPIAAPASLTVGFTGASGNYTLRYKVAAVDANGEVSKATLGTKANAKHLNDWLAGEYASLSWAAVPDAAEYLIYREEGGYYGLIGVSTSTSFRDDKYRADTSDTPSERVNPFEDGNNPSVVTFHQQRLVLAGTAQKPQSWYASRTGAYEDFSKSRPLKDDDSLEFSLASGRIDIIQWVTAFGDLLIGTAGSEYKAIGSDQGVITPSSLNVREQSFWGSLRLRPLIIGNSVLHVQRQGARVRDLYYSLERDGYAGNDLSVLAPHLFDNHVIRQWDYQQAPGSLVWAVRDDGLLLGMVYMKEHDIWGWFRFTTKGKVRSCAVTAGYLEDTLYLVVEREVQGEPHWFLERCVPRWREEDGIEQAFFVDCGLTYNDPDNPVDAVSGLEHLEGESVAILADGSPLDEQVVVDGRVELPYAACIIHVGLPYVSYLCPQTPEADIQGIGTTLGTRRAYGNSRIRLHESVGGRYGWSKDKAATYELPFNPDTWGSPVQPFTGDLEFNPDSAYTAAGEIWFSQTLPLPFTIVSVSLDVDFGG